MSEWISVEDRKPELGTESVVFNGKVMYGVWYCGTGHEWNSDYSGSVYGVTHWMQPEPPK